MRFLKNLLSNRILPFDSNDPVATECSEMGWIHTDAKNQNGTELICFLPTRIHEKQDTTNYPGAMNTC